MMSFSFKEYVVKIMLTLVVHLFFWLLSCVMSTLLSYVLSIKHYHVPIVGRISDVQSFTNHYRVSRVKCYTEIQRDFIEHE